MQRYLNDEPVLACPPSADYRLKKFVRRNKGPVLAATSLLLLLIAGIIGTSWGLVRAERAQQAESEQRQLAQANEAKALAREAETRAVLDFVESKVFAAARPKDEEGGMGYEVKLADAVKAALPFVETSFMDQPLIEARLRLTLGTSFLNLGEANIAADQYQTARTIYTKHRGADHPDTLRSMYNVARSYAALGGHVDALKLYEETLALRKAKLGLDHPDTLKCMSGVASGYEALGRHADALRLREETLARQKAKLGPDHSDSLYSMNNLALSYHVAGRHADALKLTEETLALLKAKLGPDHTVTLSSMNNLALSYYLLGRHADALKLHEETLALHKAKLGPDHPDTLVSMSNVADSYAALGRHADSLKLNVETMALRKAKLGPNHPDTLESMNNLAWLLATAEDPKIRKPAQAVELARELVTRSPKGEIYWNTLGVAQYRAGDWKAAIDTLEKSRELRKGGDSSDWFFLAMAHWRQGDKEQARKWYNQAVQWMEKNNPKDNELGRFRAEAAALLGVTEKKK